MEVEAWAEAPGGKGRVRPVAGRRWRSVGEVERALRRWAARSRPLWACRLEDADRGCRFDGPQPLAAERAQRRGGLEEVLGRPHRAEDPSGDSGVIRYRGLDHVMRDWEAQNRNQIAGEPPVASSCGAGSATPPATSKRRRRVFGCTGATAAAASRRSLNTVSAVLGDYAGIRWRLSCWPRRSANGSEAHPASIADLMGTNAW